MSDEKTSPEIAAQAARILGMDDAEVMILAMQNPALIRSVAASALAQAADQPANEPIDRLIAKPRDL